MKKTLFFNVHTRAVLRKMTTLTPLWSGFEYKEHQKYGISWMIEREKDDVIKGGLLCDEMGLGKTIQMIGLIKETKLKSTLLVTPLAVKEQWKDTAIRSKINVMYFNTHSWKLVSPIAISQPIIYIIGYESLNSKIDIIKNIEFNRLICDESHRLGNKKSKTYKALLNVKATNKWFLSATPVVNSQNDLKSVFMLLNKDLEKHRLEENMAQYTLARSMEQLRKILPDAPKKPIIKTHSLDFINTKEEEFYISIQTKIENLMRFNENGLAKIRMIMLLRQLSIHPQVYIKSRKEKYNGALLIDDWAEESTKFLKIKELLIADKEEKHKWILFCHFHSEMDMLEQYLSKLDFVRKIGKYSGALNISEKNKVLDDLREPFDDSNKNTDILLIQLKSGGVGLNLQEFDRIIFSGPWWTQSIIEQGIGRAVRIGQMNQVVVHHLLLQCEEKMSDTMQVINIDKRMNEKALQKFATNNHYLDCADRNIQSSY